LTLCSRDIQVGDKYIDGVDEVIHNQGVLSPYDYKIIGEISPNATWVTDGMEFTSDELAVPATEESNFHILSTVIHLDGSGREPYCTYLVRDSEGNFH
jgi:hypothetical protein